VGELVRLANDVDRDDATVVEGKRHHVQRDAIVGDEPGAAVDGGQLPTRDPPSRSCLRTSATRASPTADPSNLPRACNPAGVEHQDDDHQRSLERRAVGVGQQRGCKTELCRLAGGRDRREHDVRVSGRGSLGECPRPPRPRHKPAEGGQSHNRHHQAGEPEGRPPGQGRDRTKNASTSARKALAASTARRSRLLASESLTSTTLKATNRRPRNAAEAPALVRRRSRIRRTFHPRNAAILSVSGR
jgi:hypothetical protein